MEKLRCVEKAVPINIMIYKERNNFKRILDDKKAKKKLSKEKLNMVEIKSKQFEQMAAKEIFQQNSVNVDSMYHSMSEVTVKTSAADMSISR